MNKFVDRLYHHSFIDRLLSTDQCVTPLNSTINI